MPDTTGTAGSPTGSGIEDASGGSAATGAEGAGIAGNAPFALSAKLEVSTYVRPPYSS